MDYTTLLAESKTKESLPPKQGQSLYITCQQLVDGRKARGRRYDLAGVLMVLVLAKLAGMSRVLAVWERAKEPEKVMRGGLGRGWETIHVGNYFNYFLAPFIELKGNAHPGPRCCL